MKTFWGFLSKNVVVLKLIPRGPVQTPRTIFVWHHVTTSNYWHKLPCCAVSRPGDWQHHLWMTLITLTKIVQESNVVGLGLGNCQLTAVYKESRHGNWSAVLFFGSLLVWRSWGVVQMDNKTQKNKLDMSSWGHEASVHARTLFTDYQTLRYVLCSTFIFWSYSGL